MSTININKISVPTVARNCRIYTNGISSSSSSSTGSGTGTVASVGITGITATSPLTSSITNCNATIAMPAATTSVNGYLTSANWNTFNNKPVLGTLSTQAACGTHLHTGTYEPVLGNPTVSGYVLCSSSAGVRGWKAEAVAADTLATVTARGASTTLGISTGNISIKDCLTLSAYATYNTINSITPLYINYNGTNKMLVNDTDTTLANNITSQGDVTILKDNATLTLKTATSSNQTIIFYDNADYATGSVMEMGNDGVINNETYLNTHVPFSFKYDGVEKMSIDSGGVHIPSIEPALGNPTVSGYVLASTTTGTRSWVANGSGGSGSVTSVTAGNGMTQTGTATINPTLNIVSHAGTADSIGTINIGADAIGVNLGTTSTTAAAGNHLHTGTYAPVAQTMYIGTTAVAINRASAALTLAGITLTSPTFTSVATTTCVTNLNADMLDGLHLSLYNGNGGGTWNAVPYIRSDGVIEIGKYLDFHDSSYSATDYDVRLCSNGSTITSTGAIIAPANSAGTVAQVPNVIFGTGTPPTASTVPVGTIYYKYTA